MRWAPKWVSGFVSAAAIMAFGYLWWQSLPDEVDTKVEPAFANHLLRAEQALVAGDLRLAESLANRALQAEPQSTQALLIGGKAAAGQERLDDALRYYEQASRSADANAMIASCLAGDTLMRLGRLSAAEQHFADVLEQDAYHTVANRSLAFLYVVSDRRWESMSPLSVLLRSRQATLDELILVGDVGHSLFEQNLVQRAASDDPLGLLASARSSLADGDGERALSFALKAAELRPDWVRPREILGRLIIDGRSHHDFGEWQQRLPATAEDSPQIWFLYGMHLEIEQAVASAARCYWEAIRRNPNHLQASYRLSQLLVALGMSREAELLLARTRQLESFVSALDDIRVEGLSRSRALLAAELAESLGRPWEAWAWRSVLDRLSSDFSSQRPHLARLEQLLAASPSQTLDSANPSLSVDMSSCPLPDWSKYSRNGKAESSAGLTVMASVRFVDRATDVGIAFDYDNGDDPEEPGWQIYQEMGGGVAVLDFDGDGWSDTYFAQGCSWPPNDAATEQVDMLFRNLGDSRFAEVTELSSLGDQRFSQGIAVGDFDCDGFADLYVANIGNNRLYRNNGDGTFTDVTDDAGCSSDRWTTSCLLADLSGDGLPDIYDVNYLASPDALVKRCRDQRGSRPCRPTQLMAEQDQVFVNLGDGRFQDVTESAGVVLPDGKGLGIVCCDFNNSGQLSLFVANDTTPNFFLVNQSEQSLRFEERGLIAGVAVNHHGWPQACMGIAIDDADGDGLLDMLVTNFLDEANAFYCQQSGDLFIDRALAAGLAWPSVPVLGFGTQFLDADLDGLPDLVVANGHVEDVRQTQQPFRMQTQFFRNVGNRRFTEETPESLGDAFRRKVLGRAVARLDWNRDGLPDFIVTHLDQPAALVTNETKAGGRYLNVHLRGVESSRDAIGTTVQLEANGKTYTKQLTGGDGFHACNQRVLMFGLANATVVDQLVVKWPSGFEQTFTSLAVDQELILVEGHDRPLALSVD